ncbi:hypothetical protein IV203_002776 [Nitzschia inconspicua]|uniref:Mitochondrial splicing suppressor 51-like C-terminal domain-containing protein n=1 Tax=Nitzschia inconspicua TaxID=303405 RepID=A0A9K3L222_9STRA|nr:hypothetical protein IV203_002776 [Nitzschia inconspicua]
MTTPVTVVLIPADPLVALQSHVLSWNGELDEDAVAFAGHPQTTDILNSDICRLLLSRKSDSNHNNEDGVTLRDVNQGDVTEIPLLRPLHDYPGLYAYYLQDPCSALPRTPNVRATRLAMACGLLSMRLSGDILMVRSHPTRQPHWYSLSVEDVYGACEVSPDLRKIMQLQAVHREQVERIIQTEAEAASETIGTTLFWLLNAAQQNYHDAAAVARMAEVMKYDRVDRNEQFDSRPEEIDLSSDDDINIQDEDSSVNTDDKNDNDKNADEPTLTSRGASIPCVFVAKSPLCLHCRRPTSNLCLDCHGAYFCPPPRDCRQEGWSHSCQCSTWRRYVSRRDKLSSFEYLDSSWQTLLVGRDFQLSEEPYKDFLKSQLGLSIEQETQSGVNNSQRVTSNSWWRTETDGWAGGQSASAKQVDPTVRKTYEDGFAPLSSHQIPRQRRLTDQDFERAGIHTKNTVGLWKLASWQDYYRLRGIPPSSPIALLCTFPLTIYYAIIQHGEVPVTVARMLNRPLRIHVVGAEKEMNFLDLFQEVGFLLPEDLHLELVFIARQDMLPAHCYTSNAESKFLLQIEMTTNLMVGVVSGTYGATSLDPNFDVGTGPPDMIIALNAGIYAYESWRSVVDYLYHNTGVVGVFTDYNEYSGMNCAAIGGATSRESMSINPFRQPLSLPVFSMNLPQFSNGFIYVFNEQELD